MKKIYTLAITSAIALTMAGCTAGGSNSLTPENAAKLDPKKVCSIADNGIDTVLANAKAYNATAIKENVEFRRLDVNNRDLIASVEEALKTGAKEVNPLHFQSKPDKIKKSDTKLETNYALERACKFALAALRQKHEANATYRMAIPGDGYKY